MGWGEGSTAPCTKLPPYSGEGTRPRDPRVPKNASPEGFSGRDPGALAPAREIEPVSSPRPPRQSVLGLILAMLGGLRRRLPHGHQSCFSCLADDRPSRHALATNAPLCWGSLSTPDLTCPPHHWGADAKTGCQREHRPTPNHRWVDHTTSQAT